MPLTEKQKIFVGEYLINLNGTQAAVRAGTVLACGEVEFINSLIRKLEARLQGGPS